MSRYRERSNLAEAMDDLSLEEDELALALRDIRRVNRLLGGHRTSIRGLRPYLKPEGEGIRHILDIGCGDGDFLRYLAGYCRRHGLTVKLIGWDFNPKSLDRARRASAAYEEIVFECRDVRDYPEIPDNTVVICNLFLHHFQTPEIQLLLENWLGQAPRAIIVNDLHRNRVAYYLFCIFGLIFMKSPVARADGRISIRRGFRRPEILEMSKKLPVSDVGLRWCWAYRYLWILEPEKKKL